MENKDNLKKAFEAELAASGATDILSPAYRKRKLTMWGIRTLIAAGLFVYFWEHDWVKWSLLFYVPLNLFGLWLITKGGSRLEQKIASTRAKIDAMEEEE